MMQRPGFALNEIPVGSIQPAVIDCSALVDVVTGRSAARREHYQLHAPTLLDYEFASAAARIDRSDPRGDAGSEMLVHLRGLTVTRHRADLLMARIWETRHSISLYDGAYVALSRLLSAPLITRDRKLATAARPYCDVIVPE